MDEKKPLILILEDLKQGITQAVNAGISQGVPAYLIEGVLEEYLSEVRKIKCNELLMALRPDERSTEEEDG